MPSITPKPMSHWPKLQKSRTYLLILLLTSVVLVILLAFIVSGYAQLNLSTTINNTLFAAILGVIGTTVGAVLKAYYDLLDEDKKNYEQKLQSTIETVEEFYYPLALSAIETADQLEATIDYVNNTTQKGNIALDKIAADKVSELDARINYALFLIGQFYTLRLSLIVEKGGDLVLRNKSEEESFKNLYDDVESNLSWAGNNTTLERSLLQDYFDTDDKGGKRANIYTYFEFRKNLANSKSSTNSDQNRKADNVDLSRVYNDFREWLSNNLKETDGPKKAVTSLRRFGNGLEAYVFRLSSMWYGDLPEATATK